LTVDLEKLAGAPAVAQARKLIRQLDAQAVSDMVEIVRIPAPPFLEAERAQWLAERMRAQGLIDVCTDEIGNVLARLPRSNGAADGAPVILSAHLDTIFPPETEIAVRREAGRIAAPGIADNARGLAALLTIARALMQAEVGTVRPIVLVATVGEEGVGDLRGVKHLMRPGSPWRSAAAFITIDGTGLRRIVHRAIGSRRFAIRITGPGGHSWADFGLANPLHALGLAIGRLAELELSRQPRVALTVGRAGGGTSVNAIPTDAWMEIDLRSEAGSVLLETEQALRGIIKESVDVMNAQRRRGTPALRLEIRVIGDRPTGETAVNSALVRLARAATRMIDETPELVASSTDANVPIALGIPAIAIGAGGESGGTHTSSEWYVNDGGAAGLERAMLIVVGAAGTEDGRVTG
jgi:acetylornithine deacetylase/succinyl-diaminopimelate desuccinylase-like protein